MCYSIEPRETKYLKGYGFLSFVKSSVINIVQSLECAQFQSYQSMLQFCYVHLMIPNQFQYQNIHQD